MLLSGLVQINLQIQGPQKRINILDVLKPTEEEITKYYKRNSSEHESTNDSFNGSVDNKSPPSKLIIKNEPPKGNDDCDNDREENANALKRNQKPSKNFLILKLL